MRFFLFQIRSTLSENVVQTESSRREQVSRRLEFRGAGMMGGGGENALPGMPLYDWLEIVMGKQEMAQAIKREQEKVTIPHLSTFGTITSHSRTITSTKVRVSLLTL